MRSTRSRLDDSDLLREVADGLDYPRSSQGLGAGPPSIRVASFASTRAGGDIIELFRHGVHGFDILIGDAMGSGPTALRIATSTKLGFRDALDRSPKDDGPGEPRSVVTDVQAALAPGLYRSESFVTLCYARIDAMRRRLVAVDCGHMPTIHYRRAEGRCRRLSGQSMPLGFSVREVHTQETIHFAEGDIFVFYTDGLTEARNESGRIFGIARLADIVEAHADLAPEDLADAIDREVSAFAGEVGLTDDVACVVAKVGPDPTADRPSVFVTEVPATLDELSSLRAFVRTVACDQCQIPPDDERLSQLVLAVNEAASNIILHAYDEQPDRYLRATIEADRGHIQVRLSHDGLAFDPASARPPSFDGSRDGGFGVYLIAHCVENVTYAQSGDDGLRHVLLTKFLKPQTPGVSR